MANGFVYVFNVSSETINTLNTNGLSTGSIDGWSSNYTPQQLRVPRVLNANDSPGKFFNGMNRVIAAWDSGTVSFSMQISGQEFPITMDLILYVSRNRWVLYNQFGILVAEGNLDQQ
jgi:hypothetical protein